MDLKTGRVRRRAIFGDEEDESGDSDDEDEEEVSEGYRLESSASDDETEEEEDAGMTEEVYLTGQSVRRQRLEEMEEDVEVDSPAFADSDDDLERSSQEEGEGEEADESSEEEDSAAEGERDVLESEAVGEDGKPRLLQTNGLSDSLSLEKSLTIKKAILTTSDSGHCKAEEALASKDESEESFSLSTEEEDSRKEDVIRKKFPKTSQVVSGWKRGSENSIDETSDVEDLLKEEEDYKEESSYSTETSGMLMFNLLPL